MNVHTEQAIKGLFPDDQNADRAVNVKFFLGSKRGVTGDDLAEQMNRADAQVRNGIAARSEQLDGELTVKAI